MLALLAAGLSRRFGDQDKLLAPLGGKMLGLHAATRLADAPFSPKLVIGPTTHAGADQWCDLGYRVVANERATSGQATSVRLAANLALECGASALCIILADMPFVTQDHITNLVADFERAGGNGIVASACNGQAMPPVIFPKSAFERLSTLDGDAGARGLLAHARLIKAPDLTLFDIDTPDDLVRAEAIYDEMRRAGLE